MSIQVGYEGGEATARTNTAETLVREIRHAARGMVRSPGFTIIVLVPLGRSDDGTAIGGFAGCSSVMAEDPSVGRGKQGGCIGTRIVAPGYFRALSIKLRGAEPGWSDVERRAGGAVVTQALAERLWPGQDAIGTGTKGNGSRSPFHRVVGVANNIRGTALTDPPAEAVFVPMLSIPKTSLWSPATTMTLVLRSNGVPPETLAGYAPAQRAMRVEPAEALRAD